MQSYSYLSNNHPSFVEGLYADYLLDAAKVEASWRQFFEGFDYALNYASNGKGEAAAAITSPSDNALADELKVFLLVEEYRRRGHLLALTNPIRERKDRHAHLSIQDFGLSDADLGRTFAVGKQLGLENPTLANIVERMKTLYCGPMGFEYAYIIDPEAREWLRTRIESRNTEYGLSIDDKKHILQKLNETVVFEKFLHTKYVGQKRFSLEGGENTIPAIDAVINTAASLGVEEVVLGMAHRGRLNVLANIMRKTYEHIFNEFEGVMPQDLSMGDGDVKYHLGYSSQVETPSGKTVYLKLVPNPSHLEAVNPVVEGFARAKADIVYQQDYDKILPILIHGDAAVAGQGIVYEVLQMSDLEGYYTGGTVHFVINNQVGFTTDFDDARSSDYCTSLAAMVKAPVIHVNGDNAEAVVFAAKLAAEYRQHFNSDVFIDMVCYRRHGHNEGDDPQFTQPVMYGFIANHKNPRDLYSEWLATRGEVEAELAQHLDKGFWATLQERLDMVKQKSLPYQYQLPEKAWQEMRKATADDFEQSPETGIPTETITLLLERTEALPNSGFSVLPKVKKLIDKQHQNLTSRGLMDWAMAEMLGYGSLLLNGKNVRMSGQDVKRGTFSHRHVVLHDTLEAHKEYNRLNHLAEEQGKFLIYNSLLSEYAVLGFEFGYSLASPEHLTVWEAQFGDFGNGAQIIIDQFLSSSESKWQRTSGMMLLLPHGYEGQGPEHSSARLERFLQLCGELNLCVVNLTEPSNLFHAIRRQLTQPFRKPLVVMSPKSMLRVYESSLASITTGTRFREIIDDDNVSDTNAVRRVLMCSGKVYRDLLLRKTETAAQDIAIVRIEQLYPIAQGQLKAIFAKYANAEWVWVQEEPENMGAWWHIATSLSDIRLRVVARKRSASPATGYAKLHPVEQKALVDKAFEN